MTMSWKMCNKQLNKIKMTPKEMKAKILLIKK